MLKPGNPRMGRARADGREGQGGEREAGREGGAQAKPDNQLVHYKIGIILTKMKWTGHVVRMKDEWVPERSETRKQGGCRR